MCLQSDAVGQPTAWAEGKQPPKVQTAARTLAVDVLENPDSVNIAVERVNFSPAPLQLRLLCNMTAHWSQGFIPYSSAAYQPIAVGNGTLVENFLPGMHAGL